MRDLRNHGGEVLHAVERGESVTVTKDGKAVAQGEKGNLTIQLFTDKTKEQSMLKAEGKGKDGISYRAELQKAKPRKEK